MLPRILLPPFKSGTTTVNQPVSHHLIRVLRMRVGEDLVVFDGLGGEAPATITAIERETVILKVGELAQINRESPQMVTVMQALCSGDKMDWVVEKCTELGARRVIPVAAARSVLKLSGDRAEKRLAHWQRIAQAASAQCGRTMVPQVSPVMSFAEAITDWRSVTEPKTGWLLDPFADHPLSAAPIQGPITLMIGPESGWTDDEESMARQAGFTGVKMGPRILRTETAAAAVLTAIAVKCGEF
jgi:16S rRNA (uracil1498-N3)-methyltransferase